MPPPELQPGETLEPIGAASAAVVAQGTAAHPELKEGETLEPIGATKAAGDETKTPDPGVWEGIKTGGRNLLGFVKGAAQDLANPDVNVGLSKEPGSISERMQGDDTMGSGPPPR